MNVKWHRQHVLPRRASIEQRVAWHREHQQECACRPIPASLRGQMREEPPAVPEHSAAETKFSNVVLAFADVSSVTYGGKGFGSRALKLGGQMFAMLTRQREFVVRLSRARAAELAALGLGQYFDPGHGRLMKEWLVVPAGSTRWLELAREAHTSAQDRRSRAPIASRRSRTAAARPAAAARTAAARPAAAARPKAATPRAPARAAVTPRANARKPSGKQR